MAEARRHASALRLFTLACGPSADDRHVAECPDCARRLQALGKVVGGLRREAAFQRAADPAAPRIPLPAAALDLLSSARRAEGAAREIVAAAEAGDEELAATIGNASESGVDLAQALVYACQNAAKLAGTVPPRALALADAVEREALVRRSGRLRFEAALLRSQALLYRQETSESRRAVDEARSLLPVWGGDPLFDQARVDYFEGSALGFDDRYDEALERLNAALDAFVHAGLDRWIGRAEAAIGLVLLQRNNDPAALEFFEGAISRLDADEDARTIAVILLNEGGLLVHLGRRREAREKFAEVLRRALRSRFELLALDARRNLAEIALLEGRISEARSSLERLVPIFEARQLASRVVSCRLLVAESWALQGRYSESRAELEKLRDYASGSPEAFADLFSNLDAGDLAAGEISHVRHYLDGVAQGANTPYRSFRTA